MLNDELSNAEQMILDVIASFNRRVGQILLRPGLEGRYHDRHGSPAEFGPAITSLMERGFIERDPRIVAFKLTPTGYDTAYGSRL
jgi:hypothetical protein